MARILDEYEGELSVRCVHENSNATVLAQSRIQDFGHSESFSPTDLVAAALGACALNVMGAYAHSHDIDISGARAEVVKTMHPNLGPIASLEVTFRMPDRAYSEREKKVLENCVKSCPVHKSLSGAVEQKMTFIWSA